MNVKLIGNFNYVAILLYCLWIVSCKKETKKNCVNDFALEVPIQVNYLQSRMLKIDTLTFRIEIPQRSRNAFSGDTIDISVFNDLWGGIRIIKYIKDSSIGTGGFINTISARNAFQFLSGNNIFEIPNDLGRPSQEVQFFKYSKGVDRFYINLKFVAKEKGTYLIQFLNSGFRDAECYNRINHTISGYRNTDFTYLLDEAVGRVIGGPDEYYPFNYVLRVE